MSDYNITVPASSSTDLTTLARIRALCGLRPRRYTSRQLGTGTGSRVAWPPSEGSLFISPSGDNPDTSEITVYVNGVEVGVTAITENQVTLAAAPVADTVVTADFWAHPVSAVEISFVRDEAESLVAGRLAGMYDADDLLASPLIRQIVSYLAAASVSDEAYNEAGANTVGEKFPPDRLRRVGERLLEKVAAGDILLTDDSLALVAGASDVEDWLAMTNYPETRDRLFEADPFDAGTDGVLTFAGNAEAFDWSEDE